MPNELTVINCENCHAQIALDNTTIRFTNSPKVAKNAEKHGAVHEAVCPKCGTPFEIWYLSSPAVVSTHVADAELERPEVFTDATKTRVNEAAAERAEQARRTEIDKRVREERRRLLLGEQERNKRRAEEERQRKAEAERMARIATNDDGDWDDDDDYRGSDGPSQSDLDNHADQMNPNNDAYWSSRH